MRSLLLLALVATGCGTTIRVTEINTAPKPMRSRPPESVEVFTSGPPQGRPYLDIAYLEAEQASQYSVDETQEFIGELRERAAKMGCDGLVVGAPTNRSPNSGVGEVLGAEKQPDRNGIVGTCIVFTQPAAVP
ncbi:MAG TPA: hypothetical protein VGM90_10995 [Kofleriaceae bacterium]